MNFNYCINLIAIFVVFYLPLSGFAAADTPPRLAFGAPHPQTGLAMAPDEQGNTWIRGEIAPDLLSRQLVLQIPSSHVTGYDLYVYQGDQLIRPAQNSDEYGQTIRTRYPLYIFSTENPVYYLNIKQNPVSKLKVSIQDSMQYFHQESAELMRIYLYYGLIIMAMVFNVVFFLIFLDKHFATYVLLQAGLLCTFFLEDGMLHYTYPHMADHFHYILSWVSSACAVLAVMFTYYLLDLKQNSAWFKKIALPAGAILLVSLCAYLWTGSYGIRGVVNILCFMLALLCFYQAVILFRSLIYARFLLFAFGFLVLMGALYTLNEFYGNAFLSVFDVNGLRLASVSEIVAISFALIYKVRMLRKENEGYRTELRHYLELLQIEKENRREVINTSMPLTDTGQSYNVLSETHPILVNVGQQYQLTDREMEVLECLWKGASNREISDQLNISIHTAKFHVSRLYTKLDIKNRSEARMLRKERGFDYHP